MSFRSPGRAVPRHAVIIGDKRIEQGRGSLHPHIYPANGQITCEITLASPQEVDEAVRAARAASPAWRALPGDKRRDLMFKMAATIEAHTREFAELSTLENGCPSMIAPFIAADAAQKFRYFGGWADKIQGETLGSWAGPAHNHVAHEPYGVVGAIIPWTAYCNTNSCISLGLMLPLAIAAWVWVRIGVLDEESATPTSVTQRRARRSSPGRVHMSPKTKLMMPASK